MNVLFTVVNIAHCRSVRRIIQELQAHDGTLQADVLVQDRYTAFVLNDALSGIPGVIHSLPRTFTSGNIISDYFPFPDNFPVLEEYLDQLFRRHRYDAMVMVQYDRGSIESMLFHFSKQYSVPSILLQEGLIIFENGEDEGNILRRKRPAPSMRQKADKIRRLLCEHHSWKGFIRARRFLRDHPLKEFGFNGAEYIASISPYYSNKLQEKGFPKERIGSVGLARFDQIDELIDEHKISAWSDLSAPQQIRVLYPQSWGMQFGKSLTNFRQEIETVKQLSELLHEFDHRISVTYRIREGERISEYPEEVRSQQFFRVDDGAVTDAYTSIVHHDIIVSRSSTMLIEAMKLKRYCIVFDPSKEDYYGYVRSGGCPMAVDIPSLISAIKGIIGSDEVRRNIQQKTELFVNERAMMDGKASARTADFILQVVSGASG